MYDALRLFIHVHIKYHDQFYFKYYVSLHVHACVLFNLNTIANVIVKSVNSVIYCKF